MTFEISAANSSSLRAALFSGRAVLVHPEGDLYIYGSHTDRICPRWVVTAHAGLGYSVGIEYRSVRQPDAIVVRWEQPNAEGNVKR